MAYYRSGYEFEKAVFGRCLPGQPASRLKRENFGIEARTLVELSDSEHPPTQIGACLHHQVARQLDMLGINSEGLIFLPTVGTKLDQLGVDGLFFLPSLFPRLVSVDAYNIHWSELYRLKEFWIDNFAGQLYSREQFQSDLFLHKAGKAKWREENKEELEREALGKGFVVRPADFRQLADYGREENQYILTPGDTGTYEGRRAFAKLVAGYFARVAKAPSHENMALLSH